MPKGPPRKVRGVYVTPWSKMVARPYTPDRKTLQRLGRALVKAVVAEARKDFGGQPTPREGVPEGIPDSEAFYRSFSYRIVGNTIELRSTWPWIEQIVEGRDPYPMTWLTQEAGRYIVPLHLRDGTLIFRVAPLKFADAWIHPGFARHTFLQRGIRKAREAMADIISEEMVRELLRGDPTR